MKAKLLLAGVLATFTLTAQQAASAAEASPWLVRGRIVNLDPANKDSTGLNLTMNSKVFPEADISYFFTPHIATELILTYPQKQDLSSNGSKIGSFKHLPPTLSLQYHFLPEGQIRPYVGAGINYTMFSNRNLPAGVTMDDSSVGWSLQVGADFPIGKDLVLNVDVKKVQIQTDVKSNGSKLGTFKADPVLFGVGIGWRF